MITAVDAVAPLFRQFSSFVLTTHVNPDGDGLGSELALADWLIGQGKTVHILNHSATPEVYLFLDPHKRIVQFQQDIHAAVIAGAEAIVVLDTNHPDRLRSLQQHILGSRAVTICIDHHLEPAPFADHYLLDDEATSTGEIVYRLLVNLAGRQRLSPDIATSLYCAIMTDTGSFRYPRVDPEIHGIVAHLIECGADPVTIYHEVYEQWSPGRIKLLGETLARLCTASDGKLAYVTITQEMLARTGTSEEDTDNFTMYPMSIRGVVAGIVFLELKSGFKISFRSKGDIPINELAKEFGGNGHKNAAGARLYTGTLEEVRDHVVLSAAKYLSPTTQHRGSW